MSIAVRCRAAVCALLFAVSGIVAAAESAGWLLLLDAADGGLTATDVVATERFVPGRAIAGGSDAARIELRDDAGRLLYQAPFALPVHGGVAHAGPGAYRLAVRVPALAEATQIAAIEASGRVLWSRRVDAAFRGEAQKKAADAAVEFARASSSAGKSSSEAIAKLAAFNERRRREEGDDAATAFVREPTDERRRRLDALRLPDGPHSPQTIDAVRADATAVAPIAVPAPHAVPAKAATVRTYRGRILGDDGRALGAAFGAWIDLDTTGSRFFTVDADGRYTVDVDAGAAVRIDARPPPPYPQQAFDIAPAPDGSVPDLRLVRGWAIEGRVLTPTGGAPTGNVAVEARVPTGYGGDYIIGEGTVTANGSYGVAVPRDGKPVTLVATDRATPARWLNSRRSLGVVGGDLRADIALDAGILVPARPLSDGPVPNIDWQVGCHNENDATWGNGNGFATVLLRIRPGARYGCSLSAAAPFLPSSAQGLVFEAGQVWHPALRRGTRVALAAGGDAGPSWQGYGSAYAGGDTVSFSAGYTNWNVLVPDGRVILNFPASDGLMPTAIGPRRFADGERVTVAPRRGAMVTGRVMVDATDLSNGDNYGTLSAYRASDGALVQSTEISTTGAYVIALPLDTYDFKAERFPETAFRVLHLAPTERRGVRIDGDATVDLTIPAPTRTLTIERTWADCDTYRSTVMHVRENGRTLGEPVLGSTESACANGVRTMTSMLKTRPGVYELRFVSAGTDTTPWRSVDLREADATLALDLGPMRAWRPKLVDAHGREVAFGGGSIFDRRSHSLGWLYGNGPLTIPVNDDRTLVLDPPPGTRALPKQIALDTTAALPDEIVFDELPAPSGDGPVRTMLASTRDDPIRVLFIGDGYVAGRETFTDTNGNGVWDGYTWFDRNGDGAWHSGDGDLIDGHGDRPAYPQEGADPRALSEPFVDANGDGVPNVDDASLFYANVETYLRDWFGGDYWSQRRGDFEVKAAFLASPQAGVGVVDENNTRLRERASLFGATYYASRGVVLLDRNAALVAAERVVPGYDLVVVLVNEMPRGGRANATINTWPGSIVADGGHRLAGYTKTPIAHETGHALGWLGDEYIEYWYLDSVSDIAEPTEPNLTGRPARADLKWNDLVAADAPVPSTYAHDGIGLFPGARYHRAGAFRPSWNSIMRYGLFFDAVGRRELDARFARLFQTATAPPSGNWYDRRRAGHGVDLQLFRRDPERGDMYFVVFYTYDDSGKPEWYQSLGRISGGTFVPIADPNGRTLTRVRGIGGGSPAVASGDLSIDFARNEACRTDDRADARGLAAMRWSVGGKAALWCIEPAVARSAHASPDFSGHWFAPADPGWGMEVTAIDDGDGAPTLVAFLYYVDANGQPRWASASTGDFASGQPLVAYEADNGYCRTCNAPATRTQAPIGRITLTLATATREDPPGGTNRVDVDIAPPGGGAFRKTDVPITLLSEPPQ
ncbi:M64 family metallopeptidase [Tahibacter soli]|uniref:M64 family metallopeptidase n=1 Tax=Tahibacter soli TaxID=2983605 RepID=A0A9X3YL73_9GAMM|nr:M64 family metallopeptidase [Tahibacter soli]MDC8013036.1 M64 family metallopeptidase [Tahibacter soli]